MRLRPRQCDNVARVGFRLGIAGPAGADRAAGVTRIADVGLRKICLMNGRDEVRGPGVPGPRCSVVVVTRSPAAHPRAAGAVDYRSTVSLRDDW